MIFLIDFFAESRVDFWLGATSLLAQIPQSNTPTNNTVDAMEVLTKADFRLSIDAAASAAASITSEWRQQWNCMLSNGGTCISNAFLYPALNGIGILAAVGTLLFLILKK